MDANFCGIVLLLSACYAGASGWLEREIERLGQGAQGFEHWVTYDSVNPTDRRQAMKAHETRSRALVASSPSRSGNGRDRVARPAFLRGGVVCAAGDRKGLQGVVHRATWRSRSAYA